MFPCFSIINITITKQIFSLLHNKDRKAAEEEPKPAEPEKIELDKWGDPIRKKTRKIRPLSLWAQREKLEFTVHLHNLTVVEDRNARFICGVSGGGNLEILWHKDGKKIRFEKTPRILDYSADPRTACIGIECTQPSDAGTYTCTFTDKDKNESLTTSCQLIVVPRFHKTKELSEMVPPTFVRKLQCKFNYFMAFHYATNNFERTKKLNLKPFVFKNTFFSNRSSINSSFISSFLFTPFPVATFNKQK